MADIDTLSVSVQADVARFLSSMNQVESTAHAAVAAMDHSAHGAKAAGDAHQAAAHGIEAAGEAAHKAGGHHHESASAIGLAVEAYKVAGEVISKVAESVVEFGKTAIEAANEMDPKGAIEWAAASSELESSFMSLAGSIGQQLRPAIEAVMGALTRMFNYLRGVDFAAIAQGFKNIGNNIATLPERMDHMSAAAKVGASILGGPLLAAFQLLHVAGDKTKTVMSTLAEAIVLPFKTMALGVVDALSGVISMMAKVAGLAESKMHMNFGAKGLADMSAGLSANREKIGKLAEDLTKAAIPALVIAKGINALSGGEFGKALSGAGGAPKGGEYESDRDLGKSLGDYMRVLKAQQDVFKEQQQADQQHMASVRQAANEEKTAALARVTDAKQRLQEARAQLARDEGQGNLSALAGDNAAVGSAMAALNGASSEAMSAARAAAAAETDIATGLASRAAAAVDAYTKARAAANEADAAAEGAAGNKKLQLLKAEADARAQMLEGQKDALVGQSLAAEQVASRLRVSAAREAANIGHQAAVEESAIRTEAANHQADLIRKMAGGVGNRLAGSVGGSVISGATEGAQVGGVAGGVAGAALALLESSASFKRLEGVVGAQIQKIADMVGKVIDPLIGGLQGMYAALDPLISVAGAIAGNILPAFGDLLVALSAQIRGLTVPLAGIFQAIGPLTAHFSRMLTIVAQVELTMSPLGFALKALGAYWALLATGISKVVEGMAFVWNGIIGGVQAVMKKVADALDHIGMGGPVRDAANSLDHAKIDVSGFDAAVVGASNSIHDMSAAAAGFSNAAQSAMDKWNADNEKAKADWAAYVALRNSGNTAAAKAALDAFHQDQKNAAADWMEHSIQGVRQVVAGGQGNQEYFEGGKDTGRTFVQELDYLLAQQAEATAKNSVATTANTTAIMAMLTNLPAGFRLASEQFAAMGAGGGGGGGATVSARGVGNGSIHISGDLIINTTASEADILDQIKKHTLTAARRNGFSIASQVGAFTPGGG